MVPLTLPSSQVLFELVSAYCTVGLSLGNTVDSSSFSGQWSVLGKLLLIFVMLMGKHREMPDSVDAAFHDKFSLDD
tara:strand:- start:743 stop:970 length:228 start_codon:yes stop_codon:yes gene_type:complete